MLKTYLQQAINNLQSIILTTEQDLEDIKMANNDAIFERNKTKLDLIKQFESNKSSIDEEMLKLVSANKDTPLQDLIDEDTNALLSSLRKNLENLKQINTHYARIAFAVSEFYTSLVEIMIPKEKADYKSESVKSQILRVKA